MSSSSSTGHILDTESTDHSWIIGNFKILADIGSQQGSLFGGPIVSPSFTAKMTTSSTVEKFHLTLNMVEPLSFEVSLIKETPGAVKARVEIKNVKDNFRPSILESTPKTFDISTNEDRNED